MDTNKVTVTTHSNWEHLKREEPRGNQEDKDEEKGQNWRRKERDFEWSEKGSDREQIDEVQRA